MVGILDNGQHPVVLLRAEMDALPIKEETGLPYAGRKSMKDGNGKTTPVFHGCGHDMHITSLLAAAELLISAKACWHGTLVCLFQPGEENFTGAKAMVADGLAAKIPRPTVLLAQHSSPQKAGTLAIREGSTLTACERFEVRVNGRGGHGSNPSRLKDPVVTGAHIITQLQTIVSREVSPAEFAVLTCANFIAGIHASAVIPDYADMTITLRSYSQEVVDLISSSSRRIVEAGCEAGGMPKRPDIYGKVSTPATINDAATVEALRSTFGNFFGNSLSEAPRGAASEDFSVLAAPFEAPYAYWYFGCIGVERWDSAEKDGKLSDIPGNHSSGFYPDIDPTMQSGSDALALAALTFLHLQQ